MSPGGEGRGPRGEARPEASSSALAYDGGVPYPSLELASKSHIRHWDQRSTRYYSLGKGKAPLVVQPGGDVVYTLCGRPASSETVWAPGREMLDEPGPDCCGGCLRNWRGVTKAVTRPIKVKMRGRAWIPKTRLKVASAWDARRRPPEKSFCDPRVLADPYEPWGGDGWG